MSAPYCVSLIFIPASARSSVPVKAYQEIIKASGTSFPMNEIPNTRSANIQFATITNRTIRLENFFNSMSVNLRISVVLPLRHLMNLSVAKVHKPAVSSFVELDPVRAASGFDYVIFACDQSNVAAFMCKVTR